MFQQDRPYTFDRVVRIALTALMLGGLLWLMAYLSDVLIPFLVALLLAYLMNPLVLFVQRKVKSHTASVFITLFAVGAFSVILVLSVIPIIVDELAHMGRLLSEVVNNSSVAERAARFLPPDLWQGIRDYAAKEEVQDFFKTENFWKVVEAAARKVLPGVWGLIAGTASLIMGLVGLSVIGLYLVFLLMDYQTVSQGWKDLLPASMKEGLIEFVQEFDRAMNRYFRAQATVAAIQGVLFATGFWIIGLPMSILLGLLMGLLNMVPYLQVIGLIPAFLLALVHVLETGASVWVVFGLTGLVFVVLQIVQDTILVPRIMGKVTGLNPAMILLSISVWGKLLGVFGLLIALPMTCLILAYYRRFQASNRSASSSQPGQA